MTGGDNAGSSERMVEVDDSVRTVECLRGRLLAERVASRNAKEEAEQWDNKLIELEKMLNQETKSRNKAEKKLRFLMKKLESLNLTQVSDESEHSGLVDKSDFSSPSSSGLSSSSSSSSSSTGEPHEKKANVESQKDSETFHQNGSLSSNHDAYATEESSISETEVNVFEPKIQENVMRSSSIVSAEDFRDSCKNNFNIDDKCSHSIERFDEEGLNRDDDRDHYNDSDYSMAIVPVHMPPKETGKIDPEILDATVKEVLDTLKHAKESLQSSMLRRRTNMIKVG